MTTSWLKKISTICLVLYLFFGYGQIASAGIFEQALSGFQKIGKNIGYEVGSKGEPAADFYHAATGLINFYLVLVGLLFILLLIYGGWLWMSAQGKTEQVEKGKKLIIQALIGLAVILGARIIAELIIQALGRTLILA